MLFVLVPERNGVIFAAEHMQSRLALGPSVYIMYVTGNLAYFSLIKSTSFFDNVRNMLRILHLTKYSNFDFITKLNDMYMITMRALCNYG